MHTNLLHCVAVCCSVLVLQCVSAAECVMLLGQTFGTQVYYGVLQCVAVCCSVLVLQCVSAVVLRKRVRTLAHRSVAVCCSVLQFVAAC